MDPTTYDVDSIRVLSVFLEGDALNISLCAYAKIRPTFDELDAVLKVKRGDLEFVDWKPLEYTRVALLREIFQPSEQYHPSSRYRMFMAFLKMYGYPMETEIPVK